MFNADPISNDRALGFFEEEEQEQQLEQQQDE